MIQHLSSSQINLYIQCSLKYRFQYIDMLPKPFKPSGLAFGSVIHSAISWLHKEKMNGNGVTLDRLYRILGADWYAQKLDTRIRYKDGEQEIKLMVMAKEILNLYFQNPVKEATGTDVPFVVPLVHPSNGKDLGITLEGYFDLIEKDDTIVEFKTSAQTMGQDDVDGHLQLTAYSYAYQMLYQRPPRLLKIIDFVKNKKPKMVELETKRCREDYVRFFHLAGQVLRGIRQGVFFPRQSFMCKDCEYAEACFKWEGK